MIVLQLDQEVAASPYFDIHHVQRCPFGGPGWTVSGTLGDGWYEGEVSVEVGPQPSVTFADEWFDPAALGEFLQRVDRQQLCSALFRALDDAPRMQRSAAAVPRLPTPHWHVDPGHGLIAAGEPRWAVPI